MVKIRRQKGSVIGVDIGSYAIKAIECSVEKDARRLNRLAVQNISQAASDDELKDALKNIIEKNGISSKNVHISLSGPNITVRFVTMPKMSKEDLKKALAFEADKYIPFSIDEVDMDASILGDAPEEKNKMRVLLSAAKKDITRKRVELFKELGLNVKLVDIDAFCVFNAFTASSGPASGDKSIALLNLGHKYTNVIVFKENSPFFTRDVKAGGEESAAGDTAGESEPKNETPPADAAEASKSPDSQARAEAGQSAVEKRVLNSLIDEIRLSFGYYENQFGKPIDEVYVSGGLAANQDFVKLFEEQVGVAPRAWDPLHGFIIDPGIAKEDMDKYRSSLAVACGLVVRAA